LSACAFQRAETASEAKDQMIWHVSIKRFAMLGTPASRDQLGSLIHIATRLLAVFPQALLAMAAWTERRV
jgi:hypothetical protein